jgi:hypothetical protein
LRYADICILQGAFEEARALLVELSRGGTERSIADRAALRLQTLDEYLTRVRARAERGTAAPARQATATPSSNTVTIEFEREKPSEAEDRIGQPALRPVARGEERAYGDLVDLECSPEQVRVHIKVGSRIIIATAARLDAIMLTSFLPSKDVAVACGKRTAPEAVFLTWRSTAHRAEGAATIVGAAVAIEFVPRGYTP